MNPPPKPTFRQHLEVLGLDKNATKADIKAAFKRLALQHHPDKSVATDAEASETFQKIKQAYDFLLAHDGPYEDPDPQTEAMWSSIFDVLLSQATKTMRDINKKHRKDKRSRSRRDRRSESPPSEQSEEQSAHTQSNKPIDITMRVTLDELYHAKVKKLLVKVRARSQSGSSGTESEELYISLFAHKKVYQFKNKGDYLPDGTRSGINVNLEIEDHDLVRADRILCPYDLYIDMSITLYDYYFRNYMAISYFGEVLELENMRPGMKCMVVKKKGLPYYDEANDADTRGDLYVYFNLVLPTFEQAPPAEVKEMLRKHFVM